MQCRYYGSKGILFVVRYVYVVTVKAAKHNNVRSKTVKKRLNFVGEKCRGTRVFILVGKMTLSISLEYWYLYIILSMLMYFTAEFHLCLCFVLRCT